MKKLRQYTILLLFLSCISQAQEMHRYHLDINNGLPSNHVYQVIMDKYGYLWMATDKGVVKYNGYNTTVFNISSGMVKEDIWWLFEDKRGRIWCLTIADQLGYIFKDKYKTAVNLSNEMLYPDEIADYSKGIFFTSPDYKRNGMSLLIERKDTLYSRLISRPVFPNLHLKQGRLEINYIDSFVVYSIDTVNLGLHKISDIVLSERNNGADSVIGKRLRMCGNYFIRYTPGTSILDIYNTRTGKRVTYNVLLKEDRNIYSVQSTVGQLEKYPDSWIATSDIHTYVFDTSLTIIKVYNNSNITGNNTNSGTLSSIVENSFWQLCASTSKGVYINYKEEPIKSSPNFNFIDADYKYIGGIFDGPCYWFNYVTNTIAKIDGNEISFPKKLPNQNNIQRILPYNKDSALLLGASGIYWLNNETLAITPFMKSIDTFYNPMSSPISLKKNDALGALNGICYGNGDFVFLSPIKGLIHITIKDNNLFFRPLEAGRFNDIVYDSTRGCLYLYDNNQLLTYKNDSCLQRFGRDELNRLNINRIDQILVDNKYGNIFIKTYDKLLNFNPDTKSYSTLSDNIELKDAVVFIKEGKLITAGKFGVAVNKINGFGHISQPILFRNIKGSYYHSIYSAGMSGNNIILNTDEGAYYVNTSDSSQLNSVGSNITPRIFVNYNNELTLLTKHDSVNIYHIDNKIKFDIINPYGYGQVRYKYQIKEIDTAFQELSSNELSLPELVPGEYYTLLLVAYDDAWKSDIQSIQLYIKPYWYQTTWGKRTLWTSALVILLLCGATIVWITRRIVTNKNEKKNLQLGLELNAVYSQINPHFVFNTLNTAQYFIKKQKTNEAFTHINKFSRLLRAYIKSSRNKYISIEEEVQNLKNYIELQQERFEDRFEYSIEIKSDELNNRKIPALLLQPIVENAINHGLFHKDEKGYLKIVIKQGKEKHEIVCIIDDDGIGREKARLLKEDSVMKRESYGDQLIKDLINVFNKYEKIEIKMDYIDKHEPFTGTTVILTIKNFGYDK